eukprot:9048608-Pyramimonas_sp.AAC.1
MGGTAQGSSRYVAFGGAHYGKGCDAFGLVPRHRVAFSSSTQTSATAYGSFAGRLSLLKPPT